MQRSDLPFNVSILELTAQKLMGLRPITSLDSFDGITQNYHPDGLYSTLIFGRPGDAVRSRRYSYIDIKVPIFHPVIFNILLKLKRLYGGILAGNEYAKWDEEKSDFVRSDVLDGETGFHFFLQHWEKIVFTHTDSETRTESIQAIEKYKRIATTTKVLVMPAGLRDIERGPDGRVVEDEINLMYRQLLSISNTISDAAIRSNPEIIDRARFKLQKTFNNIYELFERMMFGKNKLILDKWAARRIMNGTANVITSMNTGVAILGNEGNIGFNNTAVGIFQTMKGLEPIALYQLKTGFLSKVFPAQGMPALLVHKRTLRLESVILKPKYFDRWQTNEGLKKVINSFRDETLRDKPLEIGEHYMGLIYKGPDRTFKIFQDINELPKNRSKEHVYPLTFCELMYLSGYLKWNKHPVYVTRYPITGVGSIYPSMTYVKTTTDSETRTELGDDWEPISSEHVAYEFPVPGPYVKSMAPHPAKLAKLGADFDGDTTTCNFVYADESMSEVANFLQTRSAYVGTDGRFISSTDVSTVALTMYNLTSD
jgi:hypothetical protein